jgi:flap endonuclease-1
MKNINSLSDKNGLPTIFLNILLCNIARYKKMGVKGLVYVFDNANPNPHKIIETNKRREARNKANTKLSGIKNDPNNLDCEMKQKLEKRIFTITSEIVDSAKKLLNLLGVAWIVTPEGYESEHLGAELTIDGIIDTFVTTDTDTLLFGGKSMTRRIKKKGATKYIYEEYILDNVLFDYELTREQLVHLGLVLGCDFAHKTAGIGVCTVLRKGLGVKLTEEQNNAKEYFMSKCPYEVGQIHQDTMDKDGLVQWLVNDKNFNKERIDKLLSAF